MSDNSDDGLRGFASQNMLKTSHSRRPKLSDVLHDEMVDRILSHRLALGERLPSEHSLSQEFNVSRPVVREALRRLREGGYVESRQGSGSFVAAQKAERPTETVRFSIRTIADISRFYEFRGSLEGEIAFYAAIYRRPEHLVRMKAALDEMDAAIATGASGVAADMEFHSAFATATLNVHFQQALGDVRNQHEYVIDLARNHASEKSSRHLRAVQAEHVAIYEAVKDGSSDRAREAMRTHIRNAQERVFTGIEL